MKYIHVVATLILLLSSCSNLDTNNQDQITREIAGVDDYSTEDSMSGEELFKVYCNSCHGVEVSDPNARLAPPAVVVKERYAGWFEEEDAFVERVTTWIATPTKEKSLMPGAINRFNLMPPLALPETDRKKIAKYFYDTDFEEPEWIKDHHQGGGQHRRKQGQ